MAITASDVQSLREKTGCGMMDCKKALTECDGNMEKAVDFLREKGLAVATKKASRIAAEGMVDCYVEDNTAVAIEVNSETDFVAKNDSFRDFVRNCAVTVAKNKPANVEALSEMKLNGSNTTVSDALKEKIFTIGENMNIRRFAIETGNVSSYVHGGGRIGVIINFDAPEDVAKKEEFKEMGKDICMQIAAMNPQFVSPDVVPVDVVNKEKEILVAQIKNDDKNKNKPDVIIDKMVAGKISKFYENACLLNQAFIKDGDINIAKYLENKSKELGGKITVKNFVRFEKGEGLQKKEDNFAAEVAGMANKN